MYELNFYLWLDQQIKILEAGKLTNLDVTNLVQEVKTLVRQQTIEVELNLEQVLTYLLIVSYYENSQRLREQITKHCIALRLTLASSPSLIAYAKEYLPDCYSYAREMAPLKILEFLELVAIKAQSPRSAPSIEVFPAFCPWSLEEMNKWIIEHDELPLL